MNVNVRHNILRRIAAVFATAAVAAALGSCEKIYEDLEPCPRGLSLRFIYDYNMEYANAFPKKVDCLTLFVYDAEGNYLDTRTETSAVLRDENYRMTLDLEEGSYRLVAYGGIACEKHSFSLARTPGEGSRIEDLRAAIDADCLTDDRRRNLHGFYWGDLAVRVEGDMYRDATVEMKKNTNNIRVVLQQLNDRPVDDKDFDFSVTDDNTLFGPDNDLIPVAETTYLPWSHGQASTGETDDGEEVVVAYAEFSTSRLRTKTSPRLLIRRKSDGKATGKAIVDIPLINYLMLHKSDLYAEMGRQEYLDRESEWTMVFFLDENGEWVRTHIKINDWTVRINDAEV